MVIAGCRVMTVQKTVEVPQFLFSLAKADKMVAVPVVVATRCSYSARSLTRPLCTTTGVMVQTVQFLDKVRLLGKVVDTPVVCNDRGHGPDSRWISCRLLTSRCPSRYSVIATCKRARDSHRQASV